MKSNTTGAASDDDAASGERVARGADTRWLFGRRDALRDDDASSDTKRELREQLARDVAAYFDAGGTITPDESDRTLPADNEHGRVCAMLGCGRRFKPNVYTPWQRYCSDRCKVDHERAVKRSRRRSLA